jgi:hypothetical protein
MITCEDLSKLVEEFNIKEGAEGQTFAKLAGFEVCATIYQENDVYHLTKLNSKKPHSCLPPPAPKGTKTIGSIHTHPKNDETALSFGDYLYALIQQYEAMCVIRGKEVKCELLDTSVFGNPKITPDDQIMHVANTALDCKEGR